MGAGESRVARQGLHVLRVADGSPAADAGLEPFFDYVVAAAGVPVTDSADSFADTIEANEGRSVALQVWSAKLQELRDAYVVPNRYWSTHADAPSNQPSSEPSLLGLSLRLCSPEGALETVWHVLEILEGSPAESAGLVPFTDYILGYAGGVLSSEGDFYNLVESHVDQPLRLFVYNHDYDVTRQVVIVPNRAWGNGEGLLGCGIGFGLLHRLPRPRERQYDDDESGNQILFPDTTTTPTPRPVQPTYADDSDQTDGLEIIETFTPAHALPSSSSPPQQTTSQHARRDSRSKYTNPFAPAPASTAPPITQKSDIPSPPPPPPQPTHSSSAMPSTSLPLPQATSPTRARSPYQHPPASPSQHSLNGVSSLPNIIPEEEEEQ